MCLHTNPRPTIISNNRDNINYRTQVAAVFIDFGITLVLISRNALRAVIASNPCRAGVTRARESSSPSFFFFIRQETDSRTRSSVHDR